MSSSGWRGTRDEPGFIVHVIPSNVRMLELSPLSAPLFLSREAVDGDRVERTLYRFRAACTLHTAKASPPVRLIVEQLQRVGIPSALDTKENYEIID